MRPKSMVLIVIALGCGLIASIGISQVIKTPEEKPVPKVATEQIYVAIRNVDLGQLLLPDMVELEEWPTDKIPEGAIRNIEAINDRRTLVRLYPGEPIMHAKMIDKDKFHDPTQQIPPGYRVVSVAVNAMVTAGNLVKPGDKVDLVLFIKGGRNEVRQTVARTILQNIKVFAVNTQIRRSSEGGDGPINAKHVSFLVKPDQAQKIMLAAELGKIKLSLRRSDEEVDEGFNDTTVADLFEQSDRDENPEPETEDANSNKSDITGFLAGMIASPAEEVDSNDGWEMTILNGRGQATVYGWSDKGQLPTLISGQPAGEESSAASEGLPFDQDDPTSTLSGDATAEDWLESNPIEPLN